MSLRERLAFITKLAAGSTKKTGTRDDARRR